MTHYKKILVPLDGSKVAERALPAAQTVAEGMGATLVLLRVGEPPVHAVEPELRAQIKQLKEGEAVAYLRQQQTLMTETSVQVTSLFMSGPVAEMIIRYAAENEVDLIVMSSHGRSGIGRWVYGSVAEKVLRHAPCATIILRADTEVPIFSHKRTLVTLDGSALAEQVLKPAAAVAKVTGSELVLLRVTTMMHFIVDAIDPLVMQNDLDKVEARERMEAQEYLERVRRSLAAEEIRVRIAVTTGPVAESILHYAENHDVDLIAMSSHGRSGASRWLYGSITEKVLHGAQRAMLVTRE